MFAGKETAEQYFDGTCHAMKVTIINLTTGIFYKYLSYNHLF